MDNLDYIRQSGYQNALRLEKALHRQVAGMICGLLGTGAVLLLFVAMVFLNEKYLGAASILAGFFFLFLLYFLFAGALQKYKPLSLEEVKEAVSKRELGRGLTFFAAKLVSKSARGGNLYLRDLTLTLSKEDKFLWLERRLNITRKDFLEKVGSTYQESDFLPLAEVLMLAWEKALSANHLHIRYSDLLAAIYALDKKFQDMMFAYDIEESDLVEVAYWQRRREKRSETMGKFWSRQNLLNTSGIGKYWSGGFTVELDKYAAEITERVKIQKIPVHLYGRRNQIEMLERMLIRSAGSSNVVLVGPPGIGRHTIIRAFAARVNAGTTYGPLRYNRVLEIESAAILSGTAGLNQVLDKIGQLFGEALLAENVILVINNIDAFLDPRPEAGRVNATEALLPYFQSRLRIIGITTPAGYQATLGKNPQLERLFAKLEVIEPSPSEILLILEDEVEALERASGLFFGHKALKEIVSLAGKLIQNLPNPEKSLEILQETAVYAATKLGERVVLPEHVQKVVAERTKVPVEKVQGQEKETLLNLEEILHQRIIGQDEAIRQLADALRRARSGVRSEKKPIGSFLFLGPTGVGKTETTKALAGVYFGSEQKIIRFDMSEYQQDQSVDRLVKFLTEAVIASPFSLVLLDEIEKAHPKILDLFLQVLDEGRLTDALGRTVNFTNAMIISTSNAGAEFIRQMVKEGKNPAQAREEILNELQSKGLFRPEFLNRFDGVIIFRPLSREELLQVAVLLLNELNQRLAEKDIQINITSELAQAVVKGGFSPEFGARPLRRFIQEHIENYVARGLISGEIKRGDRVEIPPEMLYNN